MKGYVLKSGTTYLDHRYNSFGGLRGALIFSSKFAAKQAQFMAGESYKIVPVEIKVVGA